jgi:hypothetical protein
VQSNDRKTFGYERISVQGGSILCALYFRHNWKFRPPGPIQGICPIQLYTLPATPNRIAITIRRNSNHGFNMRVVCKIS